MSKSRTTPAAIQLYNTDSDVDEDDDEDDDGPYCFCCGEPVMVVGVCTYCANNCRSTPRKTLLRRECSRTGEVDPLGVLDDEYEGITLTPNLP